MHLPPEWLIYTTLALIFWGITGLTQKLATSRMCSERAFLWFSYAMIGISILLALTKTIRWTTPAPTIFLAIAAGFLNGAGTLTSFRALEAGGKVSVVIPLIALYPLITVLGAMIFLNEHPSHRQAAGIVLAMVAAVLLANEVEHPQDPSRVS